MPFASEDGKTWQPIIDVKDLKILNWPKDIEAFVHYKVCNECEITCCDKDGFPLCNYEGYVPELLQYADEFKDGDYIVMEIDKEGKLKNFPKEKIDDYITYILENSETDD